MSEEATEAKELLKKWKLDQYWQGFEDDGMDDINDWSMFDEFTLINDYKWKTIHARKFLKKVKELNQNDGTPIKKVYNNINKSNDLNDGESTEEEGTGTYDETSYNDVKNDINTTEDIGYIVYKKLFIKQIFCKKPLDWKDIDLIVKILNKIINDHGNEKLRNLNYNKLKKQFSACEYCIDLLSLIGFEINKNRTRLKLSNDKVNLQRIKYAIKIIHEIKNNGCSDSDIKSMDIKTNDKDTESDEVQEWCADNGFEKLYDKLSNVGGIKEVSDLIALSSNDINDLCKEFDIKFGHKARFEKAVNELEKNTKIDELKEFLNKNGYGKYYKIIIDKKDEYGVLTLANLLELSKQDLIKLAQELKISKKYDFAEQVIKERNTTPYTGQNGEIQVPYKDYITNRWIANKSIMVLGETGAGKTTSLNSMMNYLYNIKYNDKCRLKIIKEVTKNGKKINKADSITTKVTQYYIEPPMIPYGLVLIDTPGFGDTQGKERDKKIFEDISNFFQKEIIEIDGICFVIRSGQEKLTERQQYIFKTVLKLFGKDIKDNLFIWVTYADDKIPPCLTALKADNMPYKKYFKINNSGFDIDDTNKDNVLRSILFKHSMEAFASFFNNLSNVTTKSLQQTKKVLASRKTLEISVTSITNTINDCLNEMDRIKANKLAVIDFSEKKQKYKDISFGTTATEKIRQVSLSGNNRASVCPICERTCHEPCIFPAMCWSRDWSWNGICVICKCAWKAHRHVNYRYESYREITKQPIKKFMSKYYDADIKLSKQEQALKGIEKELNKKKSELHIAINNVDRCLMNLKAIALHPTEMTLTTYFDSLIKNEKKEQKGRYEERIKILQKIKTNIYQIGKQQQQQQQQQHVFTH